MSSQYLTRQLSILDSYDRMCMLEDQVKLNREAIMGDLLKGRNVLREQLQVSKHGRPELCAIWVVNLVNPGRL